MVAQLSENGHIIYHGIQAKFYHSKKVTASDIGTFIIKTIDIKKKIPGSTGYLYSSTNLEINLKESLRYSELFKWKKDEHDYSKNYIEQEEHTFTYQTDSIEQLKNENGINILHIPCRMGKTLIAGHKQPKLIIAIAPLKISVTTTNPILDKLR